MQQRLLGTGKLAVSALGLGCMGMSQSYGPADEREAIATIHRALDLGVNFLDTADLYGPFTNARLDGRAIADRRDQNTSPDDFGPGDFRRTAPRYQGQNFARNLAVVQRINELAADKGVTSSQLAIAWVLAQGDDIVPIPGTKRRRYLEENLGALDVKLTPGELASIDAVAPRGVAAGDRYGPAQMATVNG